MKYILTLLTVFVYFGVNAQTIQYNGKVYGSIQKSVDANYDYDLVITRPIPDIVKPIIRQKLDSFRGSTSKTVLIKLVLNYDQNNPGYWLNKSGLLKNQILTFGIISLSATAILAVFIPVVPVYLAVAVVSGIIIIVEEYRANKMLIKAGELMMD